MNSYSFGIAGTFKSKAVAKNSTDVDIKECLQNLIINSRGELEYKGKGDFDKKYGLKLTTTKNGSHHNFSAEMQDTAFAKA